MIVMNMLVNKKLMKSSLMIIAFLLLVAFLYFNDPINSDYTPKCWFKVFTGLSCPGCGFQRCMHAMFHGDFLSAIKYNLFLAIGVPIVLVSAVTETIRQNNSSILNSRVAYTYLFLYFAWFIVRNVFNC
jgi:hypothetical protein